MEEKQLAGCPAARTTAETGSTKTGVAERASQDDLAVGTCKTLLSVPIKYFATLTRNPAECAVFLDIAKLAVVYDHLLSLVSENLHSITTLEKAWSLQAFKDPFNAAALPIIGQLMTKHLQRKKALELELSNCLKALESCRQTILRYAEMNRSLLSELETTLSPSSAPLLILRKRVLANAEETLAKRIGIVLSGGDIPTGTTMSFWDSIFSVSLQPSPILPTPLLCSPSFPITPHVTQNEQYPNSEDIKLQSQNVTALNRPSRKALESQQEASQSPEVIDNTCASSSEGQRDLLLERKLTVKDHFRKRTQQDRHSRHCSPSPPKLSPQPRKVQN